LAKHKTGFTVGCKGGAIPLKGAKKETTGLTALKMEKMRDPHRQWLLGKD